MSRLLSAELLKLRTTRTFLIFVLGALALSLLICILVASLSESSTDVDPSAALFDLSLPFILLLAVVATTGEWRHRTIAGTVLAAPDRVRLVVAKAIAYAAAGVVLSLVVSLATYLVATIILSARGEPTPELGEAFGAIWRGLLIAAYYGALGVGIGAIVRNQAAAIVLVLVMSFVLEPTLGALVEDVARFGPFFGGPGGLFSGTEDEVEDALAFGPALLVMVAWVVAACGAAIALLKTRDLS
jgi:hypothetical protein